MSEKDNMIHRLEKFPKNLRDTVVNLSPDQLQQKVVNWTIATNVHHICDSHINSYIRIKLALTEPNPTIKPYDESAWANLVDINAPIELSLEVIDGIHNRICFILKHLNELDWQKTLVHPELNPPQITLIDYVKRFADHGEHHLQNITKTMNEL